jgi:hypothetical protein
LKARKKVLDPSIITAARPQDVVRQVMQRTGINRTTAQHMTAKLRAGMRAQRRNKAWALLRQEARAEVAKIVGLSASRISAMFRARTSRTKKLCPKAMVSLLMISVTRTKNISGERAGVLPV